MKYNKQSCISKSITVSKIPSLLRLSCEALKEPCHEDFAVLISILCRMSLISAFTHVQWYCRIVKKIYLLHNSTVYILYKFCQEAQLNHDNFQYWFLQAFCIKTWKNASLHVHPCILIIIVSTGRNTLYIKNIYSNSTCTRLLWWVLIWIINPNVAS